MCIYWYRYIYRFKKGRSENHLFPYYLRVWLGIVHRDCSLHFDSPCLFFWAVYCKTSFFSICSRMVGGGGNDVYLIPKTSNREKTWPDPNLTNGTRTRLLLSKSINRWGWEKSIIEYLTFCRTVSRFSACTPRKSMRGLHNQLNCYLH